MRVSPLAIAAVVVFSSTAAVAAAQDTTTASSLAERPKKPVVTAASGGISMGSYQAGVDWTVSEFLRRQRRGPQPTGIDGAMPEGARVPEESSWWKALHAAHPEIRKDEFELMAASGASAGNINAVLSALAWCIDSSEQFAPQDSAFWKVWIPTGVDELMPSSAALPPGTQEEDSAFDRGHFDRQYLPIVQALAGTHVPRRGCGLPLGLTLTSVRPIHLTSGMAYDMQRFAAVFSVEAQDTGTTPRLTFVPWKAPSPGLRPGTLGAGMNYCAGPPVAWRVPACTDDRSLGALALPDLSHTYPPIAGNRTTTTGAAASPTVDPAVRSVFEVVKASSAFPVGFAPVRIFFTGTGLAWNGGVAQHALFTDGGVFDNNPHGLAVGLYEFGHWTSRNSSPILLAFSGPGNLHGALATIRRADRESPEPAGVSAILEILAGAYGSARQYERQLFDRQLARDAALANRSEAPLAPETFPAPTVELLGSSRGAPIVSEMLGGFAGFLGRPFRVYDFYAGIYDGLDYVAGTFLCDRGNETCRLQMLGALLRENTFALPPLALAVAEWRAQAELTFAPYDYRPLGPLGRRAAVDGIRREMDRWLAGTHPDSALRADDQLAFTVLRRIHWALMRATAIDASMCPKGGDTLEHLVCSDGFADFVRDLASAKDVQAALKLVPRADSPVLLDPSFRNLLTWRSGPFGYLNETIEKALLRTEAAEARIRKKNATLEAGERQHNATTLLKAARLFYRGMSGRYRRADFMFNPSSAARDYRTFWRKVDTVLVGMALPNYVTLGGGWAQGKDGTSVTSLTAGWRVVSSPPRWSQPYFVSGLFEWSRFSASTSSPARSFDQAVGLTAGRSFARFRMTSLDAGVILTRHVLSAEDLAGQRRIVVPTASARFLSDKLSVTVRGTPKGRRMSVTLGVTDINGMLYWLVR